ncbi:membrane protein [Streptomyces xylophagus]|uniref:membrane protein n=1 Tax=Streptomyces xylophagus TaxID=285514 RepID=UPI0005BBBC65|nr:membrane protein [Streptomyces xylophagus]
MAVHDHSSGRAGIRFPSRRRASTSATSVAARDTTRSTAFAMVFAGVRILTGFVFLWAFLDKTFGWGYATASGKGWVDGGSPTKGFLSGVAAGPFQSTFHSMAGDAWVNWLFMLGLLAIGVAVMSGVALRFAAVAGTVMMAMMWAAEWPPAQRLSTGAPSMSSNPLVDYHVLYAAILIALALGHAGRVWGLGRGWESMAIVRDNRWLS